LCVAVRYHLGTAAMRGAISALLPLPIRLIRALVVGAAFWIEPWHRQYGLDGSDDEGGPLGIGGAGFVRTLLALLSPIALADTAMRSETLGGAGSNAVDGMSTALPALQCLIGTPVLVSSLAILPISLVVWPAGLKLVDIESAQVGTALALTTCAHIAVSSWATFYEALSDAFLFCLLLDDAGHRAFGFHEEIDDSGVEFRLVTLPAITANTSFALWSSAYTPPSLRALLFDLSSELQDDAEAAVDPDQGDGHSLVGDAGASDAGTREAESLLGKRRSEPGGSDDQ